MNKALHSLLDTYRGSYDTVNAAQILGLMAVIIKLADENKLPEGIELSSNINFEEVKKLVEYFFPYWEEVFNLFMKEMTNNELTEYLAALKMLLQSGAASYRDIVYAIANLSEGFHSGFFHTPYELIQLAVSMKPDEDTKLYCPFESCVSFISELPVNSNIAIETKHAQTAMFAEMFNLLLDLNAKVNCSDPIASPSFIGEGGLQQFDSSFAFPAVNVKYSKVKDIWDRFPENALMGEVYHLRHMLAQSDFVAAYVSSGFLHRSAAGEGEFKRDILEKGWLKAVVALPQKLLAQSGISINLIILDKKHNSRATLFVDASGDEFTQSIGRSRNKLTNIHYISELVEDMRPSEISELVTMEGITENNFSLSPSRYVISEEEKQIQEFLDNHDSKELAEIATLIRPQPLKHKESGNHEFTEFSIHDINSVGQLTGYGRSVKVSLVDKVKASKQIIKPGDLLVVCKGAIGKVAVVPDDIPENSIASQVFSIIRVHSTSGISTIALYQFFISAVGQSQLQGVATGTTALMIASKAMANFKVPSFNEEELQRAEQIRSQVLAINTQMEKLSAEISGLNQSWPV
ncbi:N-6 DNA methylase [Paraglaciecola sp.]|uniref:N-6 DNA methylase n=1 Tax=Paraglaciecola sp. TaxID=1920173 RepID=UPI003264723C